MKHLFLFLLSLLLATTAVAKPRVSPNQTIDSYTITVNFAAGDTAPSDPIPVGGQCIVSSWVRGGSETVTIYQTTGVNGTAPITPGTSVAVLTTTTTGPTTLTFGQPYLYAQSDGASAGGILVIKCSNAQVTESGVGWSDAGTAIVATDGHDVIVGGDEDQTCETDEICFGVGTGIVTAEGFVARDQASGGNFNEFDDNPTTVPSAPSGANVRLYTTDDGELYKKDASDGAGDGNRLMTARDYRRYPFYFTDFIGPSGTNSADPTYVIWDLATISSGTIFANNGTAHHPGWFNLISATNTAGSGISILTAPNALTLAGGEVLEAVFQIPVASGTNTEVKIGFFDITASGLPADGALIRFNGSLTPSCVAITGGAGETATAFAAPITASTWYRAVVSLNESATEVYCSIYTDGSDTPIETVTITDVADIPTAAVTGSGFSTHMTDGATAAITIARIDWLAQYTTRRLTR